MTPIRLIIIAAFFSCQGNMKDHKNKEIANPISISYDFSKPSQVYSMPTELLEISGITKLSGNQFACIEDQHAKIYIFNTSSKQIEDVIHFGHKGDYEDLVKIENSYFILRSDGSLFKYSNEKTEEFPTGLNENNNPEGLCYDAISNSLLIACKDDGGAGLATHEKAIYSFSLKNNKLSEKPFVIIDINQLDKLSNSKSTKEFSPSGIAIHPVSKNIFIISSRGNLIIELDRNGKILGVNKLKNKLFIQPEGIAFNETGDLFISNEGKSEQGNILEFKYQ